MSSTEMEFKSGYCDFCLFSERVYYGDAKHSYIVELKYSKADASDSVHRHEAGAGETITLPNGTVREEKFDALGVLVSVPR